MYVYKRKNGKGHFGFFIIIFFFVSQVSTAQVTEVRIEKVWRINFINPGTELEIPTGKSSTFSAELGVGYGGSYPELSSSGNGWRYLISPFLDLQHKWFYNLEKRMQKERNIQNNSGNFLSIRLLSRGKHIKSNFTRTSNLDFAFGPTWGIQRSFGKLHLLCDVGTIYYFDTKGNGNWFPIMLQLNIGLDL